MSRSNLLSPAHVVALVPIIICVWLALSWFADASGASSEMLDMFCGTKRGRPLLDCQASYEARKELVLTGAATTLVLFATMALAQSRNGRAGEGRDKGTSEQRPRGGRGE